MQRLGPAGVLQMSLTAVQLIVHATSMALGQQIQLSPSRWRWTEISHVITELIDFRRVLPPRPLDYLLEILRVQIRDTFCSQGSVFVFCFFKMKFNF